MATIRFMPDDTVFAAKPGQSVLEAAQRAKVAVRTRCGGQAACLMCKVQVEEVVPEGGLEPAPGAAAATGLTPPSAAESRKLGYLLEEGYRLACQARIIGHVTIRVPEDPLRAAVRAQLAKQREDKEHQEGDKESQ